MGINPTSHQGSFPITAFGASVPERVESIREEESRALLAQGEQYESQGNDSKAYTCYLQAVVNCNNTNAMLKLAQMYFDGRGGVVRNQIEGARWVQKAADAGNAKAMGTIASYYSLGVLGYRRDPDQAAEWRHKATQHNDPVAMVRQGLGLVSAPHPSRVDQERAMELFRKAAYMENASGMKALGVMYEHNGDIAQAAAWYRESAIRHDFQGMTEHARCLASGEGVLTKDPREAQKWVNLAVETSVGMLFRMPPSHT